MGDHRPRFGGRPFAMLFTAIAGEALKGGFRDDWPRSTANRAWIDAGLYRLPSRSTSAISWPPTTSQTTTSLSDSMS